MYDRVAVEKVHLVPSVGRVDNSMYPSKVTFTNLPSPTYSSVTILPYQATPFPPFQPLLILGTQEGIVALDMVCTLSSEFAKMQ